MRSILTILGIALILAGGYALIYGGFNYTEEETILDVGPVQAQAEHNKRFPIHPALSVLMLGAGGFLVYRGRRGGAVGSSS